MAALTIFDLLESNRYEISKQNRIKKYVSGRQLDDHHRISSHLLNDLRRNKGQTQDESLLRGSDMFVDHEMVVIG